MIEFSSLFKQHGQNGRPPSYPRTIMIRVASAWVERHAYDLAICQGSDSKRPMAAGPRSSWRDAMDPRSFFRALAVEH